jgi:hypothetical protein
MSICTGDKRKSTDNAHAQSEYQKKANTSSDGSKHGSFKTQRSSTYTADQCESLKKMSKEEKEAIQCKKCGEYFHTAETCSRPGKLCFVKGCFQYGHIAKDCPLNKKKGKERIVIEKLSDSDDLNLVSFLTDSAASHHLVYDRDLLKNYSDFSKPKPVSTALYDMDCSSLGEGNLTVTLKFANKYTELTLERVQYVPNILDLILSCHKFNKQFETFFMLDVKTGFIYSREMNRKLTLLKTQNDIYQLDAFISRDFSRDCKSYPILKCTTKNKPKVIFANKIIRRNRQRKLKRLLSSEKLELLKREGELWHKRMGHISATYVNNLKYSTLGVPELLSVATIANCEVCAYAKLTRKSFLKDRERAIRVGEVVHADLIGPITPITFASKNKYVMCVIDDFSRYLQVFTIQAKSEAVTCLKEGYCTLRTKYPMQGQFHVLRCDNALELVSNENNV